MDATKLDELEREYSTKDVKVFNALRELRLELRIMTRAHDDLYKIVYPNKPPIFAHIQST